MTSRFGEVSQKLWDLCTIGCVHLVHTNVQVWGFHPTQICILGLFSASVDVAQLGGVQARPRGASPNFMNCLVLSQAIWWPWRPQSSSWPRCCWSAPALQRKYDRTADNKHVRHTREVAQPRRGLCDANGDPPSGCLSLLPHSKCAPVTVSCLLLQFCNRAAFPRG